MLDLTWPGKLVSDRELAHIRGAELFVLPEASHSINWEQPEAFNRNVLGFIGKEESRTQRIEI